VLPLFCKYLPFYLFVQCLKDKFGHGPNFPAWAIPGDDASDARAMCLQRKPFDRVSSAAPENIAKWGGIILVWYLLSGLTPRPIIKLLITANRSGQSFYSQTQIYKKLLGMPFSRSDSADRRRV